MARLHALLFPALLLASACGGGTDADHGAAADGTRETAQQAADDASELTDADLSTLEGVPTAEELQAEADAKITDENADEAFEQLTREIEASPEGGP